MPCFNSASFVGAAIQSMLDQTWPNWELLVMDDCSTDDTVSIVSAFQQKDSRIVLYRNTENKGIAAQLNRGIGLAKGDYIGRMDSDDLSAPGRLREQLALMEASPETVLCTTDYRVFYTDGSRPDVSIKSPGEYKAIRLMLLQDLLLCGPSFLAKADVIKRYPFNHSLVVGEDYDVFCRIAAEHQIRNLNSELYLYRKHGKSITDNADNWKKAGTDNIRKSYLQSLGIHLSEEESSFFIDLLTGNTRHKVNRRFFRGLSRIKARVIGQKIFDDKLFQQFLNERLNTYLLTTKAYGFGAYIYILFYFPEVLTRSGLKNNLRFFIRSLHG